MNFGKTRLRQAVFALLLLLLGFFGSGFTGETAAPGEVLLMAPPDEIRFSPGAENWAIPFELIDTSNKITSTEVVLRKVRVNKETLDLDKISLAKVVEPGKVKRKCLPVVPAGRYIPREDLLDWHDLISRAQQRRETFFNTGERRRAGQLYRLITQKTAAFPELDVPVNEIVIPAHLIAPSKNESYRVEVFCEIPESRAQLNFSTTARVIALPNPTGNSQWLPGDLHIHTNYSDGGKSVTEIRDKLKNKGYRFVYLSDGHHTGELLPPAWNDYVNAVTTVSLQDPDISIFPGMETGVGIGDHEGHMLAHGINNHIEGLEEYILTPQAMIDLIAARDPGGPSSSTIAHATNPFLPWNDYTVIGYHGFELMMLMPLTSKALDAELVVKWRDEVARQLDNAITGSGTFPSPRTGTDYHGKLGDDLIVDWYVTWVYSSENWDTPPLGHHDRKSMIDHSLRWGHTVASHKGSFALMTLDGKIPGSIMRNIPAGTVLPLSTEFHSVRNGNYRLRVFRDNVAETVFEATCSDVQAGDHLTWEGNITFPGGNHYYWVYLEDTSGDEEHVYTSPIFVTSLGPGVPAINAPAGWKSKPAVPVSITPGNNAASTEYRLEGATEQDWAAYSDAFQITAEGKTVIRARCIDPYGGISENVTATVKIDRTPPVIDLESAAGESAYREGNWINKPVTVTALFSDSGSGIDPATAKYSLDDGSSAAYTDPVTISNDGEHELLFQVSDLAGNTAEVPFAVKIDQVPPEAPQLHLSHTGWTRDDVLLTLDEGHDSGSGVAKNQYRIGNDGDWLNYEAHVVISTEGETTVYGRSVDRAGNNSLTTSAQVKIDRTPPQIELGLTREDGTPYEPGAWSLQPVDIVATFSDVLSGVAGTSRQYSLDDGDTWQFYTGPLRLSVDGVHQLIFRAADYVGNEAQTDPVTVKVDLNPPTAPQVELSSTTWTKENVSFTLTHGSDAGSGVAKSQYRIGNDSPWVNYEDPVTITREGSTIVYARTIDRVGRTSVSASAEVRIDRTPPLIEVEITGADGTAYRPGDCPDQPVSIGAVFTDPVGEILIYTRQYSLDGGESWLDYDDPFLLGNEGDYTVLFRVEDRAGNVGETSLDISLSFAVSVIGVTLEPSSLLFFMGEGDTAGLTATVEPAGATDQLLHWSSSSPEVASVNEAGLVTAHSPGVTQITVTTNDGDHSASTEVRVALRGDVNLDKKVDVGDAIIVLRNIVGLVQLTESQETIGDMNKDGKIDVGDAILILRRIVGL